MAAVILKRIVNSVTDQKLVLTTGRVARPFTIGSWNKIRIAMRYNLGDYSNVALNGNPTLFTGLCSGTTSVWGDATATNAIGSLRAWTAAGAGTQGYYNAYYRNTTGNYLGKKVGTTITVGAAFVGTDYIPSVGTYVNYPEIFMLDITKGSPNYTLGTYWRTGVPSPPDVTTWKYIQDFYNLCEQESLAITDHTYGTQALAFDEVAGALNAINLFWGRNQSTFEISDLVLVKFA